MAGAVVETAVDAEPVVEIAEVIGDVKIAEVTIGIAEPSAVVGIVVIYEVTALVEDVGGWADTVADTFHVASYWAEAAHKKV